MLPAWAVATPAREEHISRVVALVKRWAEERHVSTAEATRWTRAAIMHDALKDASPEELARWTPQDDWPPRLWHGPAAAAAAEAHGESDRGVLDAVKYHSIGYAGWDDVGRIVYLADYLEPARREDRERRAAWTDRVGRELHQVFREVVEDRVALGLKRGQEIRKETWELWNRLAPDASSSPGSSLPA